MHLLNAYLTTPKRTCTQIINPSNEYVQHTATIPIVSASIGVYSLDSTEATLHCHKTPSHTHKHKKTQTVSIRFASIHHVSFLYSLVGGRQEQTWRSCSGTHEIVPDAASFHYALRRLCSILYSGEKCLKPVGQDAVAFSTTRLAFEREHASLPTMKKGRFCMSLEKGSDPGKPMMRLRSIPSLRSLELYNWASDADSLPEASM